MAVNRVTVALDVAKDRLRDLRTQFGRAHSEAERETIRWEFDEFEGQIRGLEPQFQAARTLLERCLGSSGAISPGAIEAARVLE